LAFSAIEGLDVMSPATVVGGRVFERWRGQRESGFVGEHDELGAVAGVELDPWRGLTCVLAVVRVTTIRSALSRC
jgi:hypothetical protein